MTSCTALRTTVRRGSLLTALTAAALLTTTAHAADDQGRPHQVGDLARDFELRSLGGEKIKLSKTNDAGPVVVVVLRGYPGYQCPACTRQAAAFIRKANDFKQAGATVLFVYPGPADKLREHAGEFVRGQDYPAHFAFLLDPDYSFTNAWNLRWNAKNETAYPSTFVISREGKITFAKISRTHKGRSSVENVLQALRAE